MGKPIPCKNKHESTFTILYDQPTDLAVNRKNSLFVFKQFVFKLLKKKFSQDTKDNLYMLQCLTPNLYKDFFVTEVTLCQALPPWLL